MTVRSRTKDVGPAAFREAATHGGRLAAAMAAYPQAPRPWIDLSTGINPEPWTGPRASIEALSRLPDPVELARLEAVAAAAFGVADAARVVATAGAEAGLRLLPRIGLADEIEIVSPTYSGHEAAWRAVGGQVHRIELETVQRSTADAVLLVNPNNPDGRTMPRDALVALIAARTQQRRWIIVDESFVETRPDLSVADLPSDRLIVLRSFGKFYGLAGLRLGFVIAPPEVASGLREMRGEWPLGAEAVAMGAMAYADAAWRARTQADLERRAGELDALLEAHGLWVVGGTSLFRLVSIAGAAATFDTLCGAGILIRPFADRQDWLRFGLPRREDVGRLDVALRSLAR